MTLTPFTGPECHEVRAHLDSYLSGELLVETTESVHSHLTRCAACRAERDRREALRARLRETLTEPLDTAALERRIVAALTTPRRAWLPPLAWTSAAAAVLVAAALWRAASTGPAGPAGGPPAALDMPAPQAVSIPAPARAIDLTLYQDTAISHTYCALKRPMPAQPPTRAVAAEQLEGYAGLVSALHEDMAGHSLVDAHICPNGDRRYAHLIYQKAGHTSSIFVTAKLDGGLPPDDERLPVPGADVHQRWEGDFAIAAVESDDYVGLIVQDAGPSDAGLPATTIARDLSAYLKGLGARR